jgi:hypothetical protein
MHLLPRAERERRPLCLVVALEGRCMGLPPGTRERLGTPWRRRACLSNHHTASGARSAGRRTSLVAPSCSPARYQDRPRLVRGWTSRPCAHCPRRTACAGGRRRPLGDETGRPSGAWWREPRGHRARACGLRQATCAAETPGTSAPPAACPLGARGPFATDRPRRSPAGCPVTQRGG